jgi:ABC-type branched-subunit amino acid transport system substrate-binding protein
LKRRAKLRLVPVAAVIAILAVVAGGTASAGGDRAAAKGFTLRIGDAATLTGGGSAFGPAYTKAAGLAVQAANKALRQAGIKDIKIQIEHADEGSNPTQGVNAARKLISNGASCIVGSIFSGDTRAIALSAAVPAGVVEISPSSSSTALTSVPDNGLLFRVAVSDSIQGPILANAIRDAVGKGKSLSIATRNDIFGTGFVDQFKPTWEKIGGKVQTTVLIDPGATSYDSEAGKLVSGNPDDYLIITFATDYGKLGAALLRTGKFDTKHLYLGGGQPATIPDFIPKEAMEGAHGIRPALPIGTPAADAFDKLYKSSPGLKDRQTLDGNNFDATMLCILSAIAANSPKGTDMAKKMQAVSAPPGKPYTWLQLADAIRDLRAGKDINYEGIGGSIDFDANGDPTGGAFDWYQYVNSQIKVLKQYIWSNGKIRTIPIAK